MKETLAIKVFEHKRCGLGCEHFRPNIYSNSRFIFLGQVSGYCVKHTDGRPYMSKFTVVVFISSKCSVG